MLRPPYSIYTFVITCVAFSGVFVICPDGIVIVAWILCYLSEVVVLELTSAGLYLECRLLDMHTGAPDLAAGEYVARAAEIYIETVLPRTMSPRPGWAGGKKSSVRTGPLNEADMFVSAPDEIYEIICGTQLDA